jgi:hypothetical protein
MSPTSCQTAPPRGAECTGTANLSQQTLPAPRVIRVAAHAAVRAPGSIKGTSILPPICHIKGGALTPDRTARDQQDGIAHRQSFAETRPRPTRRDQRDAAPPSLASISTTTALQPPSRSLAASHPPATDNSAGTWIVGNVYV